MKEFIDKYFGFKYSKISFMNRGTLKNSDYGRVGTGYTSYKISLSRVNIKISLEFLQHTLPVDNVHLHDIDITIDWNV